MILARPLSNSITDHRREIWGFASNGDPNPIAERSKFPTCPWELEYILYISRVTNHWPWRVRLHVIAAKTHVGTTLFRYDWDNDLWWTSNQQERQFQTDDQNLIFATNLGIWEIMESSGKYEELLTRDVGSSCYQATSADITCSLQLRKLAQY